MQSNNFFSLAYYRKIISDAKEAGYIFLTMSEYLQKSNEIKNERIALLRHDVDSKPHRSSIFLEVEKEIGVPSTFFILVHDLGYNALSVKNLQLFLAAEASGFEIGLHTNFLETSVLLGENPDKILKSELNILRSYFNIMGVACHRNIDFMYNSLPYLEENWIDLKKGHSLSYQAYEPIFVEDLAYLSDGPTPHLGWRGQTPEQLIASRRSFCLSTHPHWWHRDHAFED